MHLLFSANRWFLAGKIRKILLRGVNLIVDRYTFSGVAYSLAKGLDKTWVCMPEIGLPKPDIVLFFDADATVTEMRGGFGDEILEKSDFQKKVYENMKGIFNDAYWQSVNADEPIDEVHKNITVKVDKTLKTVADGKDLNNLCLTDFGLYTHRMQNQ